jgi:hypothetical protein
MNVFAHLGAATTELCYFEGLAKWTNAERYKLIQVAESAGGPPDELSAVIKIETAGTFSPSIKNPTSSASGLIQWMGGENGSAMRIHGLTTAQIRAMNVCQQLDLARDYFKHTLPKGWKQPGDFYRAVQGGGTYHAGEEGYEKNKGWDLNKDGTITPSEVAMLAVQVQNGACSTGKKIAVTPEACSVGGGLLTGASNLLKYTLFAGAVYAGYRYLR